jgi:hypothetical protein
MARETDQIAQDYSAMLGSENMTPVTNAINAATTFIG